MLTYEVSELEGVGVGVEEEEVGVEEEDETPWFGRCEPDMVTEE